MSERSDKVGGKRPMGRATRSLVFFALVTFCVAQVAWWTVHATQRANELESAAEALSARRYDDVTAAFGAEDPSKLLELARRQRRMFLLEGGTFAILIVFASAVFWSALRREEALRRSQDRFLAGAAHELKTPLTTLRLGLESMAGGRLSEETQSAYLDGMVAQIDRLGIGIDNVLCAAGLRMARPSLQVVVADLRQDVEAALHSIRAVSDARAIHLDFEARAREVQVYRDANSMRIVLHNLLDNAIKYSPDGSTCKVTLDTEDGMAIVRVTDQGRGMTATERRHAFEAFWRGQDDHVGGSGLGLHLVRELLALQGGCVEARSEGSGRGSTLEIRLPLAEHGGPRSEAVR